MKRQDLWARLAWVSRSVDALAVKAIEVFRQANYGWTRTQADDLARQITKGECGALSGIFHARREDAQT